MIEVTIRGPQAQFSQLAQIAGLSVDHAMVATDGADQILAAEATEEAIVAIQALPGFTVTVDATEEEQNQLLAQVLQDGGPDVTGIDVA
jgi:hypothetical protein